ncbi:MAG: pyridoxal-phosphate dependent enzyme, partial [Ktedonobacteraceae bacterium]
GKEEAENWPAQEANTDAAGLRVPSAIGDRLILQAVRESGGTAVRVSDKAMRAMVCYAAQREGMAIALEAGATLAAYHMLLDTQFLTAEDEAVLFFTGSGLPEIGTYV